MFGILQAISRATTTKQIICSLGRCSALFPNNAFNLQVSPVTNATKIEKVVVSALLPRGTSNLQFLAATNAANIEDTSKNLGILRTMLSTTNVEASLCRSGLGEAPYNSRVSKSSWCIEQHIQNQWLVAFNEANNGFCFHCAPSLSFLHRETWSRAVLAHFPYLTSDPFFHFSIRHSQLSDLKFLSSKTNDAE